MSRRTASQIVFAGAALTLLVGCRGSVFQGDSDDGVAAGVTMKAGEQETLVPQSRPPIEDLPVPIGYELDTADSRSYEANRSRLVDHVYRGPASKEDVEHFYRRLMPLNGWRFRGMQKRGEEVMLRFDKDSQWCDVSIRPWNRLFGGGTSIHATIQTLTPPGASE